MRPVVLIVDDESEIRSSLRDYLARSIPDVDVVDVDNGYDALKVLKDNAVALILLDISMPGISGRDVIREIKASSPSTNIIVISRWDSRDMAEEMEQFQAEYIPKPFSLKIVCQKVREKLTGKT